MTDRVNPYAPLSVDAPDVSLWSRIREWFSRIRRERDSHSLAFEKGGVMIYGGIAFFVDPGDSTTLYAGSPSEDRSDQRLAMIAREALRFLPEFLEEHSSLAAQLRRRRLVVRIVHSYDGIWSDYYRAIEVIPAPLEDRVDWSSTLTLNTPESR